MGYIAGIDLGTSSVKVLITDLAGKTMGVGQAGYEIDTPKRSHAEQEPEIWWSCTVGAVREALHKAGVPSVEILGIGFSGQMHGMVAVDKSGIPVCPAIIWMDQRSDREAERLNSMVGELMTEELLNRPSPGMMICTLMWLKEHREDIYARIDKVLSPKDYIRFRLTGQVGSEHTDASATLAYSVKRRRWCRELIEQAGIRTDIWPEVTDSCEIVGYVTSQAAGETGLSTKTKVAAGGADSAMQLVGNGVVEEGTIACNIGTASQLAAVVRRPLYDPQMRLQTWCHPVPGTWYVQGGTLNGGSTLSWLKNKVLQDERPFAQLDLEASRIKRGAEGLLFMPYLAGERTPFLDPDARGVYFGLGMEHGKSHLVRAAMEGVMYNLRGCQAILEEMHIEKKRLISSGGAAKGITWKQIQADMFDMPVYTTETEEEACQGAAITAAVGIGFYASIAEACAQIVKVRPEMVEPVAEHVAYYKEKELLFKELYFSLESLFPKLS